MYKIDILKEHEIIKLNDFYLLARLCLESDNPLPTSLPDISRPKAHKLVTTIKDCIELLSKRKGLVSWTRELFDENPPETTEPEVGSIDTQETDQR